MLYETVAALFGIHHEKSLVAKGLGCWIPAQLLSSLVGGREASGYAVVALFFSRFSQDPILGLPVMKRLPDMKTGRWQLFT